MSEFCLPNYRVTEYFYRASIFYIIFATLFRIRIPTRRKGKFGLLRFTSGFNTNRAARCNFPSLKFISFDEANAREDRDDIEILFAANFFQNSDIFYRISEETRRKTSRPLGATFRYTLYQTRCLFDQR